MAICRAARLYERCGVDGVEVSGIDFNRRARQKTPFYLDALKAAREGISIPLFPVGGVFSRGTAEEILAQGFPLVSMSRALICEPDFAAKLKSGAQDGSKCLACNGCYTIYRSALCACVRIKTRSSVQNHPVVKKNGRARRILRRFCFHCSMTLYHVNKMEKRANLEFYRHYRLHSVGICHILQ